MKEHSSPPPRAGIRNSILNLRGGRLLAAVVFSAVLVVNGLMFDWQGAPAALCQSYLRSAVSRAVLSGAVALLAWVTIPRRKFFEWYIPIIVSAILLLTGYMAVAHAWPYSAAAAGVAVAVFCSITKKQNKEKTMKEKLEIIVDVCDQAFDEVEPAVCLVALRLGIAEAETYAPLFGNDTSTYERCLAEGKERMAGDAEYARSIRRACVDVLSEVVRSALAELGIPHGERREGDRDEVKFETEIGERPVFVRLDDSPGIVATTISARVPEQVEQEAKAFCDAACQRWAMLGKLVVENGHFAYAYRPDVPTVLDIPADEVHVIMRYGAKVIKGFEPAMQAIAQGLDARAALKLCTTTLPLL